MIEIKNLQVDYINKGKKIRAIENISLTIEKGDICTIIGPSGGGKSTLLKVLAGINKEYRGLITIGGRKIDPKTQRIGFIPQNYGLVNWKTAEENIFLSTKIKDGKRNIDIEYYKKIMKKLNIEDLSKRHPKQLSGGQRQRVSIARAFLMKPNLLLMDEPFSALDAMIREEVQKLFFEVWKEQKATTVLITHDINEAIFLGKKIVVISSAPGKVIKVVENSLFGKTYFDKSAEYGELNKILRRILKGDKDI